MKNKRYKTWNEDNSLVYLIQKKLKISPLMLLLIPYSTGIALGRYFDFNVIYVYIAIIMGFLCLISNYLRIQYVRYVFYWGICILVGVLGYGNIKLFYHNLNKKNEKIYNLAITPEFKIYNLTGQVTKALIPAGNGCKTFVKVMSLKDGNKTEELGGKINVFIAGVNYKELRPGDIIEFKTSLKPIRNYKTEGSFDFETWRASVGIKASGFIKEDSKPKIIGHKIHSQYLPAPLYFTENMRWHLLQSIERNFSEKTKGIATGLLIGEKGWIDKDVIEAFQITGTMHLLAISGLHMGLMVFFLGGAVYLILIRWTWLAQRIMVRKLAIIIALLGGTLYTALAGFSPSAVRSIIMLYALSIPFVIHKSQSTMNSLAIAGWIILLLYPIDLYSLSFQLSFISVFFLILFLGSSIESISREGLNEDKRLIDIIKTKIVDIIKPTVVCTFALSPILAWYFQKITPLSVPSNLIAVPMSNLLIMPELLLGAMLLPISETISHFVWKIPEFFINILIEFVLFVSKLPYSHLMTVRPSIYQVFFAYIVIFFMIYIYVMRKQFWLTMCIGTLVVSPINQIYYNPFEKPGLIVYTLDVGQGNCNIIRLPNRKLMVINAGGAYSEAFDIGERVIAPFIRSIGYKKIDILAFSNPDKDNTGGMSALTRMFEIGEIWSNGDTSKKDYFTEFMKIVEKKKIPQKIFKKDETIFLEDGLMLKILTAENCKECYSEASKSLVFFINYREKKILFTGDIDSKRERYIVKEGLGKTHVITVPNFGASSSSSEEFISNLTPEVGIISVGWRNYYGFPKEEALKRYEKFNTRILRTDYNGTITTRIFGGELFYSTFRKKEVKL